MNEGTLAMGHSYNLAGDGTFQARVNRDGTNGRLQINGEAGLDGNLTVVRGRGYSIDGTRYTILAANAVNGWFTSDSLPKPTPLLSFQAKGYTDRVEVEARAQSFTTAAKKDWQMKIAQTLDKIARTAKEDTSIVLGELQSLSEAELQKAFSSFSPDSYGQYTQAALQSARKYHQTLHGSMHALRLYGTPAFEPAVQARSFSDLSRQAMAQADSPLSLEALYAQGNRTRAQGKKGLWLDSFAQKGQGGTTNGTGGFDSSLNGTSFGFGFSPRTGILSGVSAASGSGWRKIGGKEIFELLLPLPTGVMRPQIPT